ncbi:Lipoxygenase, LH2 [Corchorus capsularis]|uniref:Lipoxygenase, LH2 n=1 Tax=Corchorus capsularis TaxID=210143 RepID=A0A1R3G8B8_COCAP|nr:Lipoxygenase, LH2 [Corchorus capsularis]
MSRFQGANALKRKRPGATSDALTDHDQAVLDVIRSKQDMGIYQRDIKREIHTKHNITLPDPAITKCLKSLVTKNLIKEVKNIQSRGKKHFISVDFEPSNELTGGAWYSNGSLDTEMIEQLRRLCWNHINGLQIATLEAVTDYVNKTKVPNVPLSKQQTAELIGSLILDNEVMEVKSSGTGEFASIPVGKVCYKCINARRIILRLPQSQSQPHPLKSFKVNNATQTQNNAASCSYTVSIRTSCSSTTYTRDQISLAFGDAYGNQVYAPRLDDPYTRTFERCSTDTFEIYGPCTYQVCYLYLYRSGYDGWKPESVTVYGYYTKSVTFYYNTFIPGDIWYGFDFCNGLASASASS